ncbi:MAG: tetratricopeptide repeat protein, partial [Brevundimonas sp.]
MSRTLALPATFAALILASGAPALAQTETPATVSAQTTPAAPPAAPARPADAVTRAGYDRMDALARSVFWARENEINPRDPQAGVKLALALRELGQFDQAAATAQSVLVVQPANVEAMLELGRAHIARGQAFYGIAALEQARAAAPQDWRPLSLLGVAYQQVRRTDDARAAWNEGLRLSPDNPDILTNAA